jgi:hypothetical protein
MKIHDKPGLELIAEFQTIEIEITVLEQKFINYDFVEFFGEEDSEEPLPSHYTEWSFVVNFNNGFIVHWNDYGKYRTDYKEYIKKKENEFFREIGDIIESDIVFAEEMIILNDYKTKFSLFSKYIIEEEYHYCNLKLDLLTHNNIRVKKDSEKNTSEYVLKSIIHSFLTIQKQSISDILFFLEAKIELLREIQGSELVNIKHKGKIKIPNPINTLNRYQSALLFYYLYEVGCIHLISANKLAPLISQLTGHSENTLRTEALNKIIDIKKGTVGDLTNIRKDPDFNLKEVKKFIKLILNKIDEDLIKNQNLRERNKL